MMGMTGRAVPSRCSGTITPWSNASSWDVDRSTSSAMRRGEGRPSRASPRTGRRGIFTNSSSVGPQYWSARPMQNEWHVIEEEVGPVLRGDDDQHVGTRGLEPAPELSVAAEDATDCSGGGKLARPVIPGAWLAAKAPTRLTAWSRGASPGSREAQPEGRRERRQEKRVHAHPVEGVKVRLENGASLVVREPVLPHQCLRLGQEAPTDLSVPVDLKEQLLNLVKAHLDANLPRMPTLVKAGRPRGEAIACLRRSEQTRDGAGAIGLSPVPGAPPCASG